MGDMPNPKRVRIDEEQPEELEYEPSIAPTEELQAPDDTVIDETDPPMEPGLTQAASSESMPDAAPADAAPSTMDNDGDVAMPREVPVPDDDDDDEEGLLTGANTAEVLEVSMDVHPEDITNNPLCLFSVLDDCLQVANTKGQKTCWGFLA